MSLQSGLAGLQNAEGYYYIDGDPDSIYFFYVRLHPCIPKEVVTLLTPRSVCTV